jgi:hypothetical protein
MMSSNLGKFGKAESSAEDLPPRHHVKQPLNLLQHYLFMRRQYLAFEPIQTHCQTIGTVIAIKEVILLLGKYLIGELSLAK